MRVDVPSSLGLRRRAQWYIHRPSAGTVMILALRMSHSLFVASGVSTTVSAIAYGCLASFSLLVALLCVQASWLAGVLFTSVMWSHSKGFRGFLIIYNLRRIFSAHLFPSGVFCSSAFAVVG